MKQINDIPVRRRPHSKDAQASEGAQRSRRQIWQIEDTPAPASEAAPQPEPSRPGSTPLILTNSSAAADAPRRKDAAPMPVDAPAPGARAEADAPHPSAAQAAPPTSRITEGPSAERAAPQKRAVSRPRVAEPSSDAPQDDLRAQAQASSLRQRSRPIMPASEPVQSRPAPPPQASKVNRAKTRILGFHGADATPDPLAGNTEATAQPSGYAGQFPAGWFVITDGPGRGACFTISTGVSTIGRGEDQSISLDFGDQSVSRSSHASVAYDEESNKFFIGHGGKSNVVRRNGAPVLATEEMSHGDSIRIGKTTLRFAAFCGADFTWQDSSGPEGGHG